MTSEKFIEWAKAQRIVLMFIQPGKFNQNTFIERFNRSLRDEVIGANIFKLVDYAQGLRITGFKITKSSGRMSH